MVTDLSTRRQFLGAGTSAATLALCAPALLARAAEGRPEVWKPLFNGRDLTGWTFFQEGVGETDRSNVASVDNGILHFLGPKFTGGGRPGFGHVATVDEFSNFHLRLDFKWGAARYAPRRLAKRNSGILYHMKPTRGVLYPDSVEFQVEETDVGDAIMLNTQALEGPNLGGTALWPNYPPSFPRDYVKPVVAGNMARQWFRKSGDFEKLDEWNRLDIIAIGDQAAQLVNGRIVTTLYGLRAKADDNADEWRPLTGGRIALEIEGAEIMFRNIAVKQLEPADINTIRSGDY